MPHEPSAEHPLVMELSRALSRREALKVPAILSLTTGLGIAAMPAVAQQLPANAKVLVAYFSRSGNTRVIAGQVRRALGADLFEIVPAEPYPEDYEATVRQAERERAAGDRPPLKARVPDIGSYDVVFLGFPIWGTTAPAIIRSFLSDHDLSGRIVVPFITHGGYGLGQSLSVVAAHARGARLLDGFSIEADQERRTLERVSAWLGTVRIER